MSHRMALAEDLIGKMAVAIVVLVVSLLLSWGLILAGHAVEDSSIVLQESGHFSGSGYHEISARGPLCYITILPANESILTANNGTVWKVLSNGTLREVA